MVWASKLITSQPRNTSAAIHSSYSFSSPAASLGKFISTSTYVEPANHVLPQVTCFPVFGPIFAGKFQFSGMCDSGRWTRKDHEEIKVYGGADRLHPAAGRGRHSSR